jgi:hypothetical protein
VYGCGGASSGWAGQAEDLHFKLLWDTKAIWNALSARTNLLIMYTPKGDAVYSIRADTMGAAARHVCSYFNSTGTKPAPKPAS